LQSVRVSFVRCFYFYSFTGRFPIAYSARVVMSSAEALSFFFISDFFEPPEWSWAGGWEVVFCWGVPPPFFRSPPCFQKFCGVPHVFHPLLPLLYDFGFFARPLFRRTLVCCSAIPPPTHPYPSGGFCTIFLLCFEDYKSFLRGPAREPQSSRPRIFTPPLNLRSVFVSYRAPSFLLPAPFLHNPPFTQSPITAKFCVGSPCVFSTNPVFLLTLPLF